MSYKVTISRPNGLPPYVKTWHGISRYRPTNRPGPLGHVVIIATEGGDVEMWEVVDISEGTLQELFLMLADLDTPVYSYSILKPLPAFTEL